MRNGFEAPVRYEGSSHTWSQVDKRPPRAGLYAAPAAWFYAFGDVHEKILSRAAAQWAREGSIDSGSADTGKIQATDVLRWAIDETRQSIHDSIPLWANQGLSYACRQTVWKDYAPDGDSVAFTTRLLEPEAQTLDQLYGCAPKDTILSGLDSTNSPSATVSQIWKRYSHFDLQFNAIHSVRLHEEQEREISQELQRESQIERPPPVRCVLPQVSRSTLKFLELGQLSLQDSHYTAPTMHSLDDTTIGEDAMASSGWSRKLAVSSDFKSTVLRDQTPMMQDNYLRPVNYFLCSRVSEQCLLISPHEANELYHRIKESKIVSMHIYAPRARRSQKSFETLDYYALRAGWDTPMEKKPVDDALLRQLNLFSGQLVFRSEAEYRAVCSFLGLYIPKSSSETKLMTNDGEEVILGPGDFVKPEWRSALGMESSHGETEFLTSQVQLLSELYQMRGKGIDFGKTQVGRMLDGKVLKSTEWADGVCSEEWVKKTETVKAEAESGKAADHDLGNTGQSVQTEVSSEEGGY